MYRVRLGSQVFLGGAFEGPCIITFAFIDDYTDPMPQCCVLLWG